MLHFSERNRTFRVYYEYNNYVICRYLMISHNQLTRVPASICQLRELEELDLSYNQICEVSTDIRHLSNLHVLDLSNNKFYEFPFAVSLNIMFFVIPFLNCISKSTIVVVLLHHMLFILYQVCHIPHLEVLYLDQPDGSKIPYLPEEVEFLTVQELHLEHNSIQSLPAIVAKMPNIRELYLNDNHIELLPDEICIMNELQVSLPCSLSFFSTIQFMYLSINFVAALHVKYSHMLIFHQQKFGTDTQIQ